MRKVSGLIFVMLAALFAVACARTASRHDTKAETERMVQTRLDAKDYMIDVQRAIPMTGPTMALNSHYTLRIKGDSVYSYLPYFGRAYSVPYGGGEGLIFGGVIRDYEHMAGKHGAANISFEVRTKEDLYRFTLDVYPDGSTYVTVTPNNRQGINFQGTLDTTPEPWK